MPFVLKNNAVVGEKVVIRVGHVRPVERWLVVTTNVEANGEAMQQLVEDAHALLATSPSAFYGVEIHSENLVG